MNSARYVDVTDIWMRAALAGRELDQEQLRAEVTDFLKANNLDGLTDGDDCGCVLATLAHCGELGEFCRVGKFHSCNNCVICRDNGEELLWRFGECTDSIGCVIPMRLPEVTI